jgi:peptidoglycan/xylan/chitin deacetylase (PgdA/CDA1 family)
VSRALILTYHAVQEGPAPLCIEPRLFERHLDVILELDATVWTIGELALALREDRLDKRVVALTFDDGFASVAGDAARLLAERGLVATIFCVARHLGGRSDWPSQATWAPRLPLADVPELKQLAAAGWEIGSHGLEHSALSDTEKLKDDVIASRRLLENMLSVNVRSFAYPYGVVPRDARNVLRDAGYEAACTARPSVVVPGADVFALPRVDIHYLRRPALLRATIAGRRDLYLRLRDRGARIRRLARRDYVAV